MILPSNHLNLKKNSNHNFFNGLYKVSIIVCLYFLLNINQAQKTNNNKTITQQDTQLVNNMLTDQDTINTLTIFYFTLAEIAWSREQTNEALALYLNALNLSDDPHLSEIITKRFIVSRLTNESLYAVTKWLKAAPDNLQAQLIYLMLIINSGNSENTTVFLQKLYQGTNKDFTSITELLFSQSITAVGQNTLLTITQKIHQDSPNNYKNNYILANLQALQGHYQQAFILIKPIIKKFPNWFLATRFYVELLLNTQQTKQAADFLLKKHRKRPSDNDISYLYTKILIEQKKYKSAKRLLYRLQKSKRYQQEAQLELAIIAQQEKNYKKAQKLLLKLTASKKILNKNPVYYYLGKNAQLQNNLDKAITYYNQVKPGDYLLLAQVNNTLLLIQKNQFNQAFNNLKLLSNSFPEHLETMSLLASNLLITRKKYQQAQQIIVYALKKQPNNINLLYTEAVLSIQTKNLKNTEIILKKILTISPKHFNALNTLGYLLATQTKRYQEAYTYIQQALIIKPNNPSALDSMGWILHLMSKTKKALPYLEKSYRLNQNTETAAHLGTVLWLLGDQKRAKKIWLNSFKTNPQDLLLKHVIQQYDPKLLTY